MIRISDPWLNFCPGTTTQHWRYPVLSWSWSYLVCEEKETFLFEKCEFSNLNELIADLRTLVADGCIFEAELAVWGLKFFLLGNIPFTTSHVFDSPVAILCARISQLLPFACSDDFSSTIWECAPQIENGDQNTYSKTSIVHSILRQDLLKQTLMFLPRIIKKRTRTFAYSTVVWVGISRMLTRQRIGAYSWIQTKAYRMKDSNWEENLST